MAGFGWLERRGDGETRRIGLVGLVWKRRRRGESVVDCNSHLVARSRHCGWECDKQNKSAAKETIVLLMFWVIESMLVGYLVVQLN